MGPRAKDDGRLRLHPRFPSRYLSTARHLAVYLPPGYESSGARYPVLYLQDGQNLFDPATAFGGNDWRAELTADELIAYCRQFIANYKVPRRIDFSETDLPKSGSGKVLKRVLAEQVNRAE